ncbi:MAG: YceI family protein [Chitinophagales bacterium]|nr:YceI family protein [Bacteroidota bacterium]MCB9042798.1 YceI family protein [Chitinophagales bacterium]
MIRLSLLILLFVFSNAFKTKEVEKINLTIGANSYLLIDGKSNVNTFQCVFDDYLEQEKICLEVVKDGECIHFSNAEFSFPIQLFDCGNKLMNNDFYELLEYSTYPKILCEIVCIKDKDLVASSQQKCKTAVVSTRITLAGHSCDFSLPVEVESHQNERNYIGSLHLDIRSFGLEPPSKCLGMIQVDPEIDIKFNFSATIERN